MRRYPWCRRCGCEEDAHQHYTAPGDTHCGRHPDTCRGFRPARRGANAVTLKRLRIAVPYRLRLKRCGHPAYELRQSLLRRHPDGRRQTYERCSVCLRTRWKPWGNRRGYRR